MKIYKNAYYKWKFKNGDFEIIYTDDTFLYVKDKKTGDYVKMYTIGVFQAIYKRTENFTIEYLSKEETEKFVFLEEL
jgi:hypothetical protein